MADELTDLPPQSAPSASDQSNPTPQKIESLVKSSQTGGLIQSPKSQAMLELEETGIRGGGMVLLRVIVQGLEDEVRRARIECSETKQAADSWKEKYYLERQKVAVLQERIDALGRLKILQNVLLSVGGVFAGLGAKLLLDGKAGLGGLLAVVGIGFLFAGWLWSTGFANKDR